MGNFKDQRFDTFVPRYTIKFHRGKYVVMQWNYLTEKWNIRFKPPEGTYEAAEKKIEEVKEQTNEM